MSRKYRYTKNTSNLPNPPNVSGRNQAPIRRGHAQQFGSGPSFHSEHDNRGYNPNSQRTRPPRGRGGMRVRGSGQRGTGDLRNTLRGRDNYRLNNVPRGDPQDSTYRVTIPYGDKYDQLHVMEILRESLDGENIVFYHYKKTDGAASFYVIGQELAETLRNLSRRVTTNTGQRLVIITKPEAMPTHGINPQTEATIKSAMARLYDANSNIMDLSDFRNADEFKRDALFIAVGRANVLSSIVNIIVENTPNILALNLRENRLNFLDTLRPLAEKGLPLKAIDLSKNKIHSVSQLNNLKGLDLVELVLEGNPFIEEDFTSTASYISAVRKIFKNLKKLDNEDLPEEIGFDLGEPETVPDIIPNYIPESMNTFVYQFLEAYYKLFDSTDQRNDLVSAYHSSAYFSFNYAKHDQRETVYKPNDPIAHDSHNLLRLRDESLWVKNLKTNNIDIVSWLNNFPVTQHDPASFHIDVPMYSPNFIIIIVNGLFKETFKKDKPWRHFGRSFYIVPQGQGYVIVNDMVTVTNPSPTEAQEILKANKPQLKPINNNNNQTERMSDIEFSSTPSTSSFVNQPSTSTASFTPQPNPPQPVPLAVTDPKEAITLKFMEVTNMNRGFSLKCLEENGFNPDAAYEVFQKLQAHNMIPPEAFNK